jgi:hypothetical protein
MARFTSGPPARGVRLRAALLTWAVAGAVAVLVGMIASLVVVPLLGVKGSGIVALNPGLGGDVNSSGPIVSDQTGINAHSPLKLAVDVFVLLVAALVASRMGRGAAGDSMTDVTTVARSGEPAGRIRVFLNVFAPMLVWEVLRFPMGTWSAVAVVVALWLPALVRADRRSVYSLATGTYFVAPNRLVDQRRGWLGRNGTTPKDPAQDDDASGPTLIG